MDRSLTSLKTDAVAMIDYPTTLQTDVERAGKLWQQFCALPQHAKELYAATLTPSGAVNGYEYKDGSGVRADYKENFDVTPGYQAPASGDRAADSFIVASAQLAHSIADLAITTAGTIEAECGVPGLQAIVQASRPSTFIRFLHYFGERETAQSLAEPHVDQSGLTFHLYETAPGCERLDPTTREWQPLPVNARQTVVFPAMQLQLLSGGDLKALCHRVTTNDATRQQGRFAIVAFIRFENVPEYDKATHGRLQEMTPGFNYDMPASEFSQLFS